MWDEVGSLGIDDKGALRALEGSITPARFQASYYQLQSIVLSQSCGGVGAWKHILHNAHVQYYEAYRAA